jgi:hypothetical protein
VGTTFTVDRSDHPNLTTTPTAGNASFNMLGPEVSVGEEITATVTNISTGDTSESSEGDSGGSLLSEPHDRRLAEGLILPQAPVSERPVGKFSRNVLPAANLT